MSDFFKQGTEINKDKPICIGLQTICIFVKNNFMVLVHPVRHAPIVAAIVICLLSGIS